MRCHEAEQRLSNGRANDRELAEHLANCPRCAGLATAENKLAVAFQYEKERVICHSTPISLVRSRVNALRVDQPRKDYRFMPSIVNQIKIHPRLSVGLALAVAVFLFVMLVPFSYERTSGYNVAVSFNGTVVGDIPQKLNGALASLGHKDVKLNLSENSGKTIYELGTFATPLAAREAAAALNTLAQQKGEIEISPVVEKASGSLYAQVRDKLITIRIEGTGKTDAQLQQEIADKLAENGFTGANVSVKTDASGMRQIDISRSGANSNEAASISVGNLNKDNSVPDSSNMQIHLNMSPSDGSTEINLLGKDTKNMTDAELKAAIEAKLTEQGVPNPQVTITRTADGKREVKVEARKEK